MELAITCLASEMNGGRLLRVLCKRPVVVIHVIMGIVNVVLFADLCVFCFSRKVLKACSWKSLRLECSFLGG